ncbi:hypothetical protein [Burkholderia latens]|uniref:hypothetical protein n=1 Tax=Burkholderia latens TaxID=488446 RepID=UPI001589D57C|nr:hypothetical protein [Burkholderia latens]
MQPRVGFGAQVAVDALVTPRGPLVHDQHARRPRGRRRVQADRAFDRFAVEARTCVLNPSVSSTPMDTLVADGNFLTAIRSVGIQKFNSVVTETTSTHIAKRSLQTKSVKSHPDITNSISETLNPDEK